MPRRWPLRPSLIWRRSSLLFLRLLPGILSMLPRCASWFVETSISPGFSLGCFCCAQVPTAPAREQVRFQLPTTAPPPNQAEEDGANNAVSQLRLGGSQVGLCVNMSPK